MQIFDTRLPHLSGVHHIHGWHYILLHLQSGSAFSSPRLMFTFMDSETVGWVICRKRQQFFSPSVYLLLYISLWLMYKGLCCQLAIRH